MHCRQQVSINYPALLITLVNARRLQAGYASCGESSPNGAGKAILFCLYPSCCHACFSLLLPPPVGRILSPQQGGTVQSGRGRRRERRVADGIAGYRAEIQGHVIPRLHAPCCVTRSSPVVVLLPPTWPHAVFLPFNFWASLASGPGEGKKKPKSFAPPSPRGGKTSMGDGELFLVAHPKLCKKQVSIDPTSPPPSRFG